MQIKPILFNTEMVKAILQGRKTQTRRIVKPHYHEYDAGFNVVTNAATGNFCYIEYYDCDERPTDRLLKPPYIPGDILWVREAWCNLPVSPGGHTRLMRGRYYYKADVPDIRPDGWRGNWKPSIHMPKEAARIFLRVVNIRAEQLQRITKEDALAEGADEIESWGGRGDFIKLADYTISNYAKIWDKTVPKADLPRYGWAANPWVWVILFERVEKPEEWV